MANLWRNISTWFWNPDIWIPPGYNWDDFVSNEKTQFANWNDLWSYPFYIAAIATAIRFLVLNPFLYGPIAKRCGLKDIKVCSIAPNKWLKSALLKHKDKVPSDVTFETGKAHKYKEIKVEQWLHQHRPMTRASNHNKFIENSWQFTYHTFIFFFGWYVLWDKPWLWDIMECYSNYPFHSLDMDVWWYYMLSLGYYWSMTFTLFFQFRRSDFWHMLLHHIVTILLLIFSWAGNGTRIGTLVLIINDFSDIPLQITKLCKYSAPKHIVNKAFKVLALSWIISKIVIFPLWIIRSALFDPLKVIPINLAYYIFNGLLVSLQCLHIFWTYRIIKIILESKEKPEGKLKGVQTSVACYSELPKEDQDEIKME